MPISKAQINAASSTLDETDIAMMVTAVRISSKYIENPAYYRDVTTRIEDADGTVYAKMLNAAMSEIVDLGIGVVEIDQRIVGGSDGLYYSQLNTRNDLINYILGVLYPESFESITVVIDADGNRVVQGEYQVAQREVKLWR